MELRHIAGFVAVAEELHFGRAAARLNMAQPPLSQQVRGLEKELGVRLFERNTRSVRLTPAGANFLPHARQVLSDAELARRAAVAGSSGEVGRVSIGFAGASSHEAIPTLTKAVRAAYPGIELRLEGQTYAGVALARVADRELDIGFVRLPVRRSGVRTRVIQHERLVAALPSDHRLAGEPALDVADLAEEPFVAFPGTEGSSVRENMVRIALDAGYMPRIVQEAPDSYTILDLVAAGVGVTITVSSVQHIRRSGMVYRELRGDVPTIDSALAWREDNASAALHTVLRVAEQVLPTPSRSDVQGLEPGLD
ncbi:DNA-binding transcriptional LysR family regulator [Lipingzhangella halophila]|uniref:DNA-binding transcriptional LysR family regulator n=1 Tax=Lipingzhangella halophila TaxID=1783352 RepID=A0A7W7W346_9ACTN|nr:LysR family transcriptional regulator [Lipingzhangella halophila]MBB4932667.1 DNA-binding transcriptional LysR family regulator [Lipingzhangella halophila]